MPMPEMITDRTNEDVANHANIKARIIDRTASPTEWLTWLSGMRGAYNVSDLNRVGEAVAYIADRLVNNGIAISVTAKNDWVTTDIPRAAQMVDYLEDIGAIRAALATFSTTPTAPDSMNDLTVGGANDIEKILVDVETLLNNLEEVFLCAAQPLFYSGFALYSEIGYYQLMTADGLELETSDGMDLYVWK